MTITPTPISGCFQIQPTVYKDERGCFFESFQLEKFHAIIGEKPLFVQDNQADSFYGVVRGLHYQKEPHAQAKWIRVVTGEIRDVVVDLRKTSPTYRQKLEFNLSADNRTQLYIPRGCAHGYAVLSDKATVLYKTDQFYVPNAEKGITPLDAELAIDWGIPPDKMHINSRDKAWPTITDQDFV